jgi:hypothetical protein
VKQRRQDAALDGTGVETTSASAHCVSRAGRKRARFVKLMLGVLCESVNSAIKRMTGSTLRSRKQNTLFAEAALKVVAYAVKV